jgi:hypothetical protein
MTSGSHGNSEHQLRNQRPARLSPLAKGVANGLSAVGTIGLALAAFVQLRHPITAIWILAAALLLFVAAFWVYSRALSRYRSMIAALAAILITVVCGVWDHKEVKMTRPMEKSSMQPNGSVQQTTQGAGSAAVNGNGNTVTTNGTQPTDNSTKEEKK